MRIKGKILLIGGGEYRGPRPGEEPADNTEETREAIDEFSPLIHLCPDPETACIEIVTTGTAYPRESFERYESFFKSKGVTKISMLDVDTRYAKEDQIERVKKATVLLFGGGNQRKILEMFSENELLDIIRKRLKEDDNFTIAGTSAGTMAITELTIGDGYDKNMLLKGDVDIRTGLNFLHGCIADTHFLESMRISRLTLALLENRDMLGIGLSENSGVIIRDGDLLETAGKEMVLLFDASDIKDTNFREAANGDPVYAMGMKLHYLSPGAIFSVKERKLVR